eukprot:6488245-Amphidinium_carterae.1
MFLRGVPRSWNSICDRVTILRVAMAAKRTVTDSLPVAELPLFGAVCREWAKDHYLHQSMDVMISLYSPKGTRRSVGYVECGGHALKSLCTNI